MAVSANIFSAPEPTTKSKDTMSTSNSRSNTSEMPSDSQATISRKPLAGTIAENEETVNPIARKPVAPALAAEPTHDFDHTAEFAGEVNTNNDIPSREVLKSIEDYAVFDRDGKSLAFKNIYSGRKVARRVMVIFIRHFLCGNCQEYLRTLSSSITTQSLLALPTPTFIAVIGCGSPQLISMYAEATSCPFPIYADPTQRLYSALGMLRTLNPGTNRPEYQRKGVLAMAVQSVVQGVRELGRGKLITGGEWRAGDMQQVGGEFLFEPLDMEAWTPVQSPNDDLLHNTEKDAEGKDYGFGSTEANSKNSKELVVEEKIITWCHRMRNTRDHAEIPEVREVLGLPADDSFSVGDAGSRSHKRWTRALGERKGTGLSGRTSKSLSPGRYNEGRRSD